MRSALYSARRYTLIREALRLAFKLLTRTGRLLLRFHSMLFAIFNRPCGSGNRSVALVRPIFNHQRFGALCLVYHFCGVLEDSGTCIGSAMGSERCG